MPNILNARSKECVVEFIGPIGEIGADLLKSDTKLYLIRNGYDEDYRIFWASGKLESSINDLRSFAEDNPRLREAVIRYTASRMCKQIGAKNYMHELLIQNIPGILDLSEKIANFEEEYTNTFNC